MSPSNMISLQGLQGQIIQTAQGTQLLTSGNSGGGTSGGLQYSVLPAMQTVTIDGQEAIFIPTGGVAGAQQVQLAHNQTLMTANGQIIRAPASHQQQQSMGPFTLQNVGSAQSQGMTVRTAGGMQQVLQLPMQQTATISVQVPVSTANGQTVYQTLQLPVQMISSALPGLMQGGTQMQVLSQLQVPQQQQQQYAQIITPSGQIQTVQIANLSQMGQTATLLSPGSQQQQQQTANSGGNNANSQNNSSSSGTVTITTSSDGNLQINTVDNNSGGAGGGNASANAQQNANAQQQMQQQQQQQITISSNGQVTMIPASSLTGLTRMQTTSLANLQAFPIQNIPGLGNVQVIPAASLQALTGQQTLTQQGQLPPGTQIIAASSLGQQLQQDPNDPTKWQVVTTGNPQTTQLVTVASAQSGAQLSSPSGQQSTDGPAMEVVMTTTNAAAVAADAPTPGANSGSSNNSASSPAKPRLRRVACTCPNCKDGEGKQ